MAGDTGVYAIDHQPGGKRYVGSAMSFRKRWTGHRNALKRGKHHSQHLQRVWDKYGPDCLTFTVLLLCDRENAVMYEQLAMNLFQPEFNSAPVAGSQLGYKHRPETLEKMSAARKGIPTGRSIIHTEETKRRISAAKAGVVSGPPSAETRAKIGAAHKGRPRSAEYRARISKTLTGHKQSASQIEKRMQHLRGRPMPEGFGAAVSARMVGLKLPASHCLSIGRSMAKLSEDQVRSIRGHLAAGCKQSEMARLHSVDRSVISEINTGKSYRWVV